MKTLSFPRSCCAAFAILAIVCLSSCAVPLAPGYKIEKQSITVRFVPGSPPHLSVRAEYRLANTGTTPLDAISIGLPGAKGFGRAKLQVEFNGNEVTPQIQHGENASESESAASQTWPTTWKLPFPSAWGRKQKRNLVIQYDLAETARPDLRILLDPKMFSLNDSGWFPRLLAPKNLFAANVVRPDPTNLFVYLPAGFVATGSGQPSGTRTRNGQIEYRFRIRAGDFAPYIIAGQYQQQKISTSDGTVKIWTFQSISPAEAQKSAAQIAAAARFYTQTFGPLPRHLNAISDVQLPDKLPANVADRDRNWERAQAFFLPGIVYDWVVAPDKSFWSSLGNGVSGGFGEMALGDTWFGHIIRPRPEAWFLGEGLVTYASESLDENRPGSRSRTSIIASDLQAYENDLAGTGAKTIALLTPKDSEAQLQLGADKLQLFFFALEDRCGRDNLNRAIAHMVYALRGQQYGYEDFRAALEQECHQDLAGFFHSWLDEKGIPADFRAKYEPANADKN